MSVGLSALRVGSKERRNQTERDIEEIRTIRKKRLDKVTEEN